VSVITGKLDEVTAGTKDVTADIEIVRERLAEESERLVTVSMKALKASEEASSTFARQSNAMFKAAQDATKQIDAIRDSEWKAKRDAFLSSAKFVVESLHSLSVDITRISEGGIQEKAWKSYQSGDIGAFTRRLVEMGDKLPIDKIRDKYSLDSEFRNYVARFVRQFEEVYDQALTNDHGDLLGATFSSSDVGKLYQILCTAMGREPRKPKDAGGRKAA
jgi:Asp-tRNA(Asn)/Glu-tRNA(Gln) amidotransferase A subunit family amidase